jgi:uncharacterized protein Yka (UPF0111/DUF47 family)
MSLRRWLLPHAPDVLGLLRTQSALTVDGMDAFARWASGDAAAADAVRAAEHRADDAKRAVLQALRTVLVTPLEPEDVFALSRGIDWILNHAKDAVGESEVMACPPDETVAAMAAQLLVATRALDDAVRAVGRRGADPTGAAEAAVKEERRLEKIYRAGMAALLDLDDPHAITARRELYRRCSRIGENVDDVAELIIYAVVRET